MMWAYLTLVFIGSTAAQVVKLGSCPDVAVKPDFDASQFVGKWYESQRYFTIFEAGGKCTTATYTANPNGTIGVLNRQINTLTGNPTTIEGYATQNQDEKAKLSVVFPSLPLQVEAPYWVVDTDYTTYAAIWSCRNVSIFSARFVWVLTREQQPPASVLASAFAVLDNNKIDRSSLQVTDQVNCSENSA